MRIALKKLRYASDFVPSWAGAVSIDLLPAVLVGIMAVVHASMRRAEEGLEDAERMTAADLLRSLELNEALAARSRSAGSAVAEARERPHHSDGAPAETRAAAENVTTLTLAERKRQDP